MAITTINTPKAHKKPKATYLITSPIKKLELSKSVKKASLHKIRTTKASPVIIST